MHERVLAVPLIRTSRFTSAERRALQRRAQRGELRPIRPGVLVDPAAITDLLPEEHHLLLVRATAHRIRPPRLLAHRSAALAYGLPLVGAPPDRVELRDPRRSRVETTAYMRTRPVVARAPRGRWAGTPPYSPSTFAGVTVEPLVDVLVDVAATEPLCTALPIIDAALHGRRLFPSMLSEAAEASATAHDKAAIALGMGSALSDSPAESVCRVRFRQLGAPAPVQQHVFTRPGERTAVVDFWFPDQGVVVEVDGRGKYGEGPEAAAAHWQEKQREDFVRSFPEVRTVVRVVWADLVEPERLRVKLLRAGIPCR